MVFIKLKEDLIIIQKKTHSRKPKAFCNDYVEMTTVSKNSIPDDIERENEILKKNIAEFTETIE